MTKTQQHSRNRVDVLNINIGLNLRLMRRQKKYTLKDLASVLSISIQQMTKYEKGVNRISASKLMLVAIATNTDIMEFYK